MATTGILFGTALILPEVQFLGLDFSAVPNAGIYVIQLALVLLGLDIVYRNLVYDYR